MAVEDIGLADPQGLITKTIMTQRKAFPAASVPGGNAPQAIPWPACTRRRVGNPQADASLGHAAA